MKTTSIILIIGALLLAANLPAQNLLLKNGTVYTFEQGVLEGYDLLIEKGRISRIGKNLKNPAAYREIDLAGKSVIPGIIDSHNHIGLLGGINEFSANVTPEADMALQVYPDDPNIYYSLSGGVTMAHNMHGSANPIGGQNVTIKLKWGKEAEELIEKRATPTLKMALGENPKSATPPYPFPASRMGVSAIIRDAFNEAAAYRLAWKEFRRPGKKSVDLPPPRIDYRLEPLVRTLEGKTVVRCHTYRAEESLELIRLSEEFGFKIAAFEHFHQAYRIADVLAEKKIAISVFADSWNYKLEASEFTPYGFQLLHEKGVEISLNSDTSEIMRRLYMEAGKMRRYAGMNDLEALSTITINPARLLGVDHFTGSIETGKEADLAVFDGHPLSAQSKCVLTIIEGEIYFDRDQDLASRKKPESKGEEK